MGITTTYYTDATYCCDKCGKTEKITTPNQDVNRAPAGWSEVRVTLMHEHLAAPTKRTMCRDCTVDVESFLTGPF